MFTALYIKFTCQKQGYLGCNSGATTATVYLLPASMLPVAGLSVCLFDCWSATLEGNYVSWSKFAFEDKRGKVWANEAPLPGVCVSTASTSTSAATFTVSLPSPSELITFGCFRFAFHVCIFSLSLSPPVLTLFQLLVQSSLHICTGLLPSFSLQCPFSLSSTGSADEQREE